MSKVTDAAKGVNSEGEQLDVLGVEGGDNVEAGGVRSIAMEFCLWFLIMPPVVCRSCSVSWDT